MSCGKQAAATQLRRLGSLPYFGTITAEAFTDFVDTLADYAETVTEAKSAVDVLLSARRLPQTREDVVDAINAARGAATQRAEDTEGHRGFCDRCREGRPPGWIYEKRLIKGNPYEFSGRCKCQSGGWV